MVLIFVVIKFDGNMYHTINTIRTNFDRGRGMNLVPFDTIGTYISDMRYSVGYMNILGNIVPFIPLGFLLPMAFPSHRNFIKTMFSSLLIIISVEVLQLVLYLGSFDVDDIILNGISCSIGFILFIAYKKVANIDYQIHN